MRAASLVALLASVAGRRPAPTSERGCGRFCAVGADGASRVAVGRAAYENVTAAAVVSARRVAAKLSTDCSLALRRGGAGGIEIVATVGGVSWVAGVGDVPAAAAAALASGGGLCRTSGSAARANTRVAVYTLVDGLAYLAEAANARAFANKAAFCARTGRRLFVVVVGEGDASLHDRDPPPWQACSEPPGNQLSVYKAPGALRLLDLYPEIECVLYLDADAWFAGGADDADLDGYADLLVAENAALLGVQNKFQTGAAPPWGRARKIVLNGGVLLVRRSDDAERLLGLWWRGRCGVKDQLPLWAALFAHWHVHVGAPYDASAFETYKTARRVAIPALAKVLGEAKLPRGQLAAPAKVGAVLLIPALPVGDLPALRSDQNWTRPTFLCHTKPDRPEQRGQCDARDACAGDRCAIDSFL